MIIYDSSVRLARDNSVTKKKGNQTLKHFLSLYFFVFDDVVAVFFFTVSTNAFGLTMVWGQTEIRPQNSILTDLNSECTHGIPQYRITCT